ncbi:MAG: cytochrome c biogenesis protein CcdA [Acidimicrobiales bacterium]
MRSALLPIFAVVAGMISFTSPCALPLIPSYLSYISGIPLSQIGEGHSKPLVLRSSLAFVAGFTAVFTALGATSTLLGSLLLRHLPIILRISGIFIIIFGLATMGLLRIPFLVRERRFDLSKVPVGPRGAFPLGMAFAFGWTPCIGPVLATVLGIAGTSSTLAWGVLLLALYSLGLGLPFVLLGLGFTRARGSLAWLRTHGRKIELAGGLMLVVIGILFVTGLWREIFVPLQSRFARLGWPPL